MLASFCASSTLRGRSVARAAPLKVQRAIVDVELKVNKTRSASKLIKSIKSFTCQLPRYNALYALPTNIFGSTLHSRNYHVSLESKYRKSLASKSSGEVQEPKQGSSEQAALLAQLKDLMAAHRLNEALALLTRSGIPISSYELNLALHTFELHLLLANDELAMQAASRIHAANKGRVPYMVLNFLVHHMSLSGQYEEASSLLKETVEWVNTIEDPIEEEYFHCIKAGRQEIEGASEAELVQYNISVANLLFARLTAHYGRTRSVFEVLLSINPSDIDLQLEHLGFLLEFAGRRPKEIDRVEKLLTTANELATRFPDNVDVKQYQFWAMVQLGRYQEVIESFESLCKETDLGPLYAAGLSAWAYRCVWKTTTDKSKLVSYMQKHEVPLKDENEIERTFLWHIEDVKLSLDLGDIDKAKTEAFKLLESVSWQDFVSMQNFVHFAFVDLLGTSFQVELLERFADLFKNHLNFMRRLFDFYEAKGEEKKAFECLKRCAQLAQLEPSHHFKIACSYMFSEKNLDAALLHLPQSVDPEKPSTLGNFYFTKAFFCIRYGGSPAEAIAAFDLLEAWRLEYKGPLPFDEDELYHLNYRIGSALAGEKAYSGIDMPPHLIDRPRAYPLLSSWANSQEIPEHAEPRFCWMMASLARDAGKHDDAASYARRAVQAQRACDAAKSKQM